MDSSDTGLGKAVRHCTCFRWGSTCFALIPCGFTHAVGLVLVGWWMCLLCCQRTQQISCSLWTQGNNHFLLMPGAILPVLAEPLEGCTFVPRAQLQAFPISPRSPWSRLLRRTGWLHSLAPFFSSLPFTLLLKVIYLFLVVLGLRCCVQAFSSWGKWGLLFSSDAQASPAMTSLVAEHRL